MKYHKASSIQAFGAPYLQLAWSYSLTEQDAAHAADQRQVQFVLLLHHLLLSRQHESRSAST